MIFGIFDPGIQIFISERWILFQREIQEANFWARIFNSHFQILYRFSNIFGRFWGYPDPSKLIYK